MKFLVVFTLVAVVHSVAAGFYAREAAFNGEIGSTCEYDEDCITPHAYCRNNRICECKKKYQFDQGSRACFPTQLGLRCHVDGDCVMANSRCFEEVCQCRSNHVAPEPSADCLPSSRLQASCVDDSQCRVSDDNTHCNMTSHLCDCLPNYHPSYDTQKCIANKRIKEACITHQECASVPEQQDKVECRLENNINRCVCRQGFTPRGNLCVRGGDGGSSAVKASIASIFVALAVILH